MKTPKNLILENWIDEFSKLFAKETIKIIKEARKPSKDEDQSEVIKAVYGKFLQAYVEAIITESLTEHAPKVLTEKEKFKLTSAGFSKAKSSVQDEIAEGFNKAFHTFAGVSANYYCIINPAPEPQNKLAC